MDKKQNDGLALIVGGLFILALVFATYNYFNKGSDPQDTLAKRIEQMQKEQKAKSEEEKLAEKESAIPSELALETNTQGDINGNGVTTSSVQNTTTMAESYWKANDYNEGDITGDTYTVKEGDTLWEIAEAVYGNGADWIKILNANSANIGYLPNGQQALIMSGQVLNLVR